MAGTPLRVLDTVRNQETLIPVTVLAGGADATGLLCGRSLTLTGGDSSLDTGAIVLAARFVAGVGEILTAVGPNATERSQHQVSTGQVKTGEAVGFESAPNQHGSQHRTIKSP
ncbi:hypothetical protein [Streptomyces azureus]|uniref:Uncharacterized protein n=1 Tax=Streptomyces azureus TaxID=146537 RepID=A0A0K8PW66_STRAJ|nr:hypothetical protein [Streptomyces azureus]GAP52041.1 uncharacterized protein SAZU_6914 [Streptomyces azureus]